MTASELPKYEMYVSACSMEGTDVRLRVVTDYFPRDDRLGEAFEISLSGCICPEPFYEFLLECKCENSPVYLVVEERSITVYMEHDREAMVQVESILIEHQALNNVELREGLRQIHAMYLSEGDALRASLEKIRAIERAIIDQQTRIQRKAQGHAGSTTASVLYSQHLAFCARLSSILSPAEKPN